MNDDRYHGPFCDCYECWPPDVAQAATPLPFDDLGAMSLQDHARICNDGIGQSAWRYVTCPECGEQVDQFGF